MSVLRSAASHGPIRAFAALATGLLAASAQLAFAAPVANSPGGSIPSAVADPGPRSEEPPGREDLPPLKVLAEQARQVLADANSDPEIKGTGPYPAKVVVDIALPHATIYRPADLQALGDRKLGVVIWGNGACANDGASASSHLAEIASHGYLAIAPGTPLSGPLVTRTMPGLPKPAASTPMTTTIQDLRELLEWALAEGDRPGSPYFGLIDKEAVASAGHSCGGMQAILLADDPRVRTAVVHNSGINKVIPSTPPLVMDMGRLKGLHGSVLFIVGGPEDVLWREANDSYERVDGIPAALVTSDVGHGGTFDRPHGGMAARIALDWLEWQLRGDRQASLSFVGGACRLCNSPDWEIRKKNIP